MADTVRGNAFYKPRIGDLSACRVNAKFSVQNVYMGHVEHILKRTHQVIPRYFSTICDLFETAVYIEVRITHQLDFKVVFALCTL